MFKKRRNFNLKNFVILTDSACDLPQNIINDLEINELGLICNIDNKEYIDDINIGITHKEFYNKLREGIMPSTSQINSFRFVEIFEEYVKKEIAILYLAFSSSLSGTICPEIKLFRGSLNDVFFNNFPS